ncbi:DNA sulfur modification protein DndD [Candidatus Protofrankia californiensis]|uniref:DNA sulfur modification protein DndD n=1 Tax=Candidatus Protofrankia californiensis TaxID=1839754 RepID=UPI0010411FCC|nr:DNA sulfur modification protein DndD [Candidatus Protofrankia californiensis]
MIFDEVVLQDYGAFAGRQVVPLSLHGNRPVVVIGALNGSGKTTLLEAVQLALYGPLAPPTSRRGLAYDTYLARAIHHAADPGRGAAVELALRAHIDGVERAYRIRRRWRHGGGRVRDELRVSVDGQDDPGLAEAWTEHVETLVPRGIAGLFFFDGEQIEAFADLAASRELLQTAIGGLLGLDLVDRLVSDLDLLERRRRTEAASDETTVQLTAAEQHITQLEREVAEARHAYEDAQADLTAAHKQLAYIEEQLVREGGRAYRDRLTLERRAQAAQEAVAVVRARLVDAVGESAPFLLVPDLLARLARQAHGEQEQADNQLLAQILASRDAQLLDVLRELASSGEFPPPAIETVAQWMGEDRDRRSTVSAPSWLGMSPDALATLDQLLDSGLAAARMVLTRLLDEHEQAVVQEGLAKRDLDTVPHGDVIEDLDASRAKAAEVVSVAARAVKNAEAAVASSVRARGRAETRRHSLLEQIGQAQLAEEDAQRFLEHTARARDTLAHLRLAATERHASRIQARVLEACRTLFHKPDLIADVRIDPATYALTLVGADGRAVETTSLSAGERQLFGVALLWGLARAAGRPLPVIIDTPLGRLDGPHRARFAERYLPNAAHQVIVLATDTEVGEDTLQRADTFISHTLHLATTPRGTVVREGPLPLPPAVDMAATHDRRASRAAVGSYA